MASQNNAGTVIALSEGIDSDILQVVYENGVFTQWDMISTQDVKSQKVFSLNLENFPVYQLNTSINFNANGTYLIVPNKNRTPYIQESLIWKLSDMEQITIFDTTPNHVLYPSIDMEFSASEKTVSMSYGLFGTDDGGGGVLLIRDQHEPDFTRIAIDPAGDYLAIADKKGNIILGDISATKTAPQSKCFTISPARAKQYIISLAIQKTIYLLLT